MRLELLLFFAVLDLFVERDALQKLQHEVVLVTILKDLEEAHEVLLFELAQDFKLVEDGLLCDEKWVPCRSLLS